MQHSPLSQVLQKSLQEPLALAMRARSSRSIRIMSRQQCCKASPRATADTHSHESSPCAGAACAHTGGQSVTVVRWKGSQVGRALPSSQLAAEEQFLPSPCLGAINGQEPSRAGFLFLLDNNTRVGAGQGAFPSCESLLSGFGLFGAVLGLTVTAWSSSSPLGPGCSPQHLPALPLLSRTAPTSPAGQ